MHTAYQLHGLVKLPLDIECIHACEDQLFVGAKQGHILLYGIKQPSNSSSSQSESSSPPATACNGDSDSSSGSSSIPVELEPKVQLLRTDKSFSKKPIQQLAAVREQCILVVLTNGQITAHDMDISVSNFPVITVLERARGASLFSVDCVRQRTLTGETAVVTRMAVAVKRKIQFYYWKNRKFLELYGDVNVPEVPKTMKWYKDSICIGYRNHYMMIKMDRNQELCELFPTGQNQYPQITVLHDDRFGLQKNNQTAFIDLAGNLKLNSIAWGGSPLSVCHDPPYLIGVQNNMIEVKTEEPRLSIQTLIFEGARHLSSNRHGLVYVASNNEIRMLKMEPIGVQIPQMLRNKQFELAVILTTLGEKGNERKKEERIRQIKTLCAFDLFCTTKFKESLDLFYELCVDPSHVIGLYTDFLPPEFRNQIQYPDRIPAFQGRELEKATDALVEFLTHVRHRYRAEDAKKDTQKPLTLHPMIKGVNCIASRKQLLQIIDTTLLKSYLRRNESLVAPLLRLKDNECHLEETERALIKAGKMAQLVIFYNTRANKEKELAKEEESEEVKHRAAGAHEKAIKCRRRAADHVTKCNQLHQRALSLLRDHYNTSESSVASHMNTVRYLQNLGPENKNMIFRNAGWIFQINEADALEIFTEDIPEVETLPRREVLDFLLTTKKSAVIPYLEHVINEWGEKGSVFHDTLLLQYKDAILNKMADIIDREDGVIDRSAALARAVDTEEEVRLLRMNLKKHLSMSQHFSAALVLAQFPYDCLEEERAILLGSLQQHTEALTLYLYKMRDYSQALEYCQKHYEPNSDIFTLLFIRMMEAPEPSLLRQLSISTDAKSPTSLADAIELLRKFGSKIDEREVIRLMPSDLPFQKLFPFVRHKLQHKTTERHIRQIEKSLRQAEYLQLQAERIRLQATHVIITDTDLCPVCRKRFGNQGAFVRVSSGEVVHFSCRSKVAHL